MNSIAKFMDQYDIAQEIRLERRVHKGSFLLLEGKTDIKKMEKFIDENLCSIVNSYGKKNSTLAIEMLNKEKFKGILGVVDADFDRVIGFPLFKKNIVYSEFHDLDLDWARVEVLTRYFSEVADQDKCRSHGSTENIVLKIMSGLLPVSVAKLLNARGDIRNKLSEIDVSKIFKDFSANIDEYVDLISDGRRKIEVNKDVLKKKILSSMKNVYDLFQITNGHDFFSALGASLRCELGNRRENQSWGSEVEMHIRLIFTDDDFKKSRLYSEIKEWESQNHPYSILKL